MRVTDFYELSPEKLDARIAKFYPHGVPERITTAEVTAIIGVPGESLHICARLGVLPKPYRLPGKGAAFFWKPEIFPMIRKLLKN